jgi:hypothetical protein
MGQPAQRRQSLLQNLMRRLSMYRRNKPNSAGIVVKALINQRRRNLRRHRDTFGCSRQSRCEGLFHASLYVVPSQKCSATTPSFRRVLVATVKAEPDGMYKYTQFNVYLYREEFISCVSSCVDDAGAIEKVKTTQ